MMHTDDLISDMEVASAADSALDMDASERAAYMRSRDPRLLKDQPGRASRRFILRALTSSEVGALESLDPSRKLITAFLMGVKEIRNFPTAGLVASPSASSPVPGDTTRRLWSDKELTSIMQKLGSKRIFEVGQIIHERATEGNDEGGSTTYEPLPLLLGELAKTERLHAEHLRASAATTPST